MRRQLERVEEQLLAPYAVRSSEASRRYRTEDEGRAFDYRTPFQHDRDRIVYSRAFRRLRQKSQAGLLPGYADHRRNRLTHTLEVTQLARTIGRALRLNEDLVEAVALAHDMGHPPFGPAGERALDDLLSGRLDGRVGAGLGDLGGFGRAWQSLRVVDRLEKRYRHPGLNLTDPVREGILKSDPLAHAPKDETAGLRPGRAPLFEVQVVRVADRIASALHDLDDAMQSETVEVQQVERLGAVRQLRRKLGRNYQNHDSRFMKVNAIHRGLTHLLVTGVIATSERVLARWAERHEIADGRSFRALRDEAVRGTEIGLTAATWVLLEELERFLEGRVRRGHAADRTEGKGRRVLLGLFASYHADPSLLQDHVLLRYKELAGVRYLRDVAWRDTEAELEQHYRRAPSFVRLLGDHLAGMTDAFALAEHRRLLAIGAVPIPGAEQLRRERTVP
jgi:dGTPase